VKPDGYPYFDVLFANGYSLFLPTTAETGVNRVLPTPASVSDCGSEDNGPQDKYQRPIAPSRHPHPDGNPKPARAQFTAGVGMTICIDTPL